MAYTYVTVNGQRVEANVNAAFQRLRAAFHEKFGLDLIVSSGTRTRAEQQELYRLFLSGRGNLAAPPGQSNHEESGPRGPRALDVRDSGSDAGVTVSGTTRAKWLRANAPKYGFNPAGYTFSRIEPWHIEFTGPIGISVPASTPASTPATPAPSTPINTEQEQEEMPVTYINVQGEPNKRRGGCYAIMRSNAGVLFAQFVSATPLPGVPTISGAREKKEWDTVLNGLK